MCSLSKGIDASLGGLVWVRRRNGRWWPGRILGPDELPESGPSPKSGTAIKLLGREDASVDWYNVEKSTRVKAFRCGEYDECIEKAEVTAANSVKKAVKYATKEDAILHALQIERACLGKDHPGSNSTMTNQGNEGKDSPKSFHHNVEAANNVDKESSNSENETDSAHGLLLSSVTPRVPFYTRAYKEETTEQSLHDSEDVRPEGVEHMKEVVNLETPVITSSKRKRFPVARVHEFLKKEKEHHRRTATKRLESNMMVNVPVVYEKLAHPTRSLPRGASFWEVTGLSLNSTTLKYSLKDNGGSSDNELYDVPIATEEQQCADIRLPVYNTPERGQISGGTISNESSQVETVSLGESPSTSSCSADDNNIIQGVDNAISNWQFKRKRSRHTKKNRRLDLRKSPDVYDEFDAYVAGAECGVDHDTSSDYQPSDNNTRPLKSRAIADIEIEDCGWRGNAPHFDRHISLGSEEPHAQERLISHREPHFSMNYHDFMARHHTAKYLLFEVDLEVKANYRPQRVPYVSLSSKLTGQSIVGHPLTVEVLEDGFCDNLVSDLSWNSNSSELDGLRETSSPTGGGKLDHEAMSNSVGQVPLKHAMQNVTPSKWKKHGFPSQKFRKLSSLSGARNEKKLIVDKVRGPSLNCVPLTIALSRLNEALNCPNRPTRRP